MTDRLRGLIDLVVDSLDHPDADGRALAREAGFSRDHLDRLLAAATGESPVALRRRLLLERAAWQLRTGSATPTEAAGAAGYGSLAAFSRSFKRAYGVAPTAFTQNGRAVQLDAPNGIHFHPPAGLLLPGRPAAAAATSPSAWSPTTSTAPASCSPPPRRSRPTSWPARCARASSPCGSRARSPTRRRCASGSSSRSRSGSPRWPGCRRPSNGPRRRSWSASTRSPRASSASPASLRDRGAWDDAFVDALCEPPQSFTYGGVFAHVLEYGAIRREMLASVLRELGATLAIGDPILWEMER